MTGDYLKAVAATLAAMRRIVGERPAPAAGPTEPESAKSVSA
jgi:hypothetical protein